MNMANIFHVKFTGGSKYTKYRANVFYKTMHLYRQNESMDSSGIYRLLESYSDKNDMGVWFSISRVIPPNHTITSGIDIKKGIIDVSDIYRTSWDEVYYLGDMYFYGFFLQDEVDLIEKKIKLITGIRYDLFQFINGTFTVEKPTLASGFTHSLTTDYDKNEWYSLSPGIATRYFINNNISTYLSFARGFKSPVLDDLCRTGLVNGVFMVANPDLQPEMIDNFEWGTDITVCNRHKIRSSVYYSTGKDFQHLVSTGDFVDTGEDDLQPVYQKQNVKKIEITGCEISVNAEIIRKLTFTANYSYNNSIISEFNITDTANADLTGNALHEVAPNLCYAGLIYENRFFITTLTSKYVDRKWCDETNTQYVDHYTFIDLKVSKMFKPKITVSLNIHNLLDTEYIDSRGYLSAGRFILMEARIGF